jgi:hypothetical protein
VRFWANEITRLPGNFRTRDKILILPSDATGRFRDLLAQKSRGVPQTHSPPSLRTLCDLCAMLSPFTFFLHGSRDVAQSHYPPNLRTLCGLRAMLSPLTFFLHGSRDVAQSHFPPQPPNPLWPP